MDSQLGETIVALQGGLVNINLSAALDNVEGWQTRLAGAEFSHSGELRAGLRELAARLSRGDLMDVGDLLAQLGQWTGAGAADAPADVREDVAALGELLTRAANQPL